MKGYALLINVPIYFWQANQCYVNCPSYNNTEQDIGFKDMGSSTLREFLESSTIHGLVHISTAKSRAARTAWAAIVVACFATAIYIYIYSVATSLQNCM